MLKYIHEFVQTFLKEASKSRPRSRKSNRSGIELSKGKATANTEVLATEYNNESPEGDQSKEILELKKTYNLLMKKFVNPNLDLMNTTSSSDANIFNLKGKQEIIKSILHKIFYENVEIKKELESKANMESKSKMKSIEDELSIGWLGQTTSRLAANPMVESSSKRRHLSASSKTFTHTKVDPSKKDSKNIDKFPKHQPPTENIRNQNYKTNITTKKSKTEDESDLINSGIVRENKSALNSQSGTKKTNLKLKSLKENKENKEDNINSENMDISFPPKGISSKNYLPSLNMEVNNHPHTKERSLDQERDNKYSTEQNQHKNINVIRTVTKTDKNKMTKSDAYISKGNKDDKTHIMRAVKQIIEKQQQSVKNTKPTADQINLVDRFLKKKSQSNKKKIIEESEQIASSPTNPRRDSLPKESEFQLKNTVEPPNKSINNLQYNEEVSILKSNKDEEISNIISEEEILSNQNIKNIEEEHRQVTHNTNDVGKKEEKLSNEAETKPMEDSYWNLISNKLLKTTNDAQKLISNLDMNSWRSKTTNNTQTLAKDSEGRDISDKQESVKTTNETSKLDDINIPKGLVVNSNVKVDPNHSNTLKVQRMQDSNFKSNTTENKLSTKTEDNRLLTKNGEASKKKDSFKPQSIKSKVTVLNHVKESLAPTKSSTHKHKSTRRNSKTNIDLTNDVGKNQKLNGNQNSISTNLKPNNYSKASNEEEVNSYSKINGVSKPKSIDFPPSDGGEKYEKTFHIKEIDKIDLQNISPEVESNVKKLLHRFKKLHKVKSKQGVGNIKRKYSKMGIEGKHKKKSLNKLQNKEKASFHKVRRASRTKSDQRNTYETLLTKNIPNKGKMVLSSVALPTKNNIDKIKSKINRNKTQDNSTNIHIQSPVDVNRVDSNIFTTLNTNVINTGNEHKGLTDDVNQSVMSNISNHQVSGVYDDSRPRKLHTKKQLFKPVNNLQMYGARRSIHTHSISKVYSSESIFKSTVTEPYLAMGSLYICPLKINKQERSHLIPKQMRNLHTTRFRGKVRQLPRKKSTVVISRKSNIESLNVDSNKSCVTDDTKGNALSKEPPLNMVHSQLTSKSLPSISQNASKEIRLKSNLTQSSPKSPLSKTPNASKEIRLKSNPSQSSPKSPPSIFHNASKEKQLKDDLSLPTTRSLPTMTLDNSSNVKPPVKDKEVKCDAESKMSNNDNECTLKSKINPSPMSNSLKSKVNDNTKGLFTKSYKKSSLSPTADSEEGKFTDCNSHAMMTELYNKNTGMTNHEINLDVKNMPLNYETEEEKSPRWRSREDRLLKWKLELVSKHTGENKKIEKKKIDLGLTNNASNAQALGHNVDKNNVAIEKHEKNKPQIDYISKLIIPKNVKYSDNHVEGNNYSGANNAGEKKDNDTNIMSSKHENNFKSNNIPKQLLANANKNYSVTYKSELTKETDENKKNYIPSTKIREFESKLKELESKLKALEQKSTEEKEKKTDDYLFKTVPKKDKLIDNAYSPYLKNNTNFKENTIGVKKEIKKSQPAEIKNESQPGKKAIDENKTEIKGKETMYQPVAINIVSQNKGNKENLTKSLKKENNNLKKDQNDSLAPNLPHKFNNLGVKLKSLATKVKDMKEASSESAVGTINHFKENSFGVKEEVKKSQPAGINNQSKAGEKVNEEKKTEIKGKERISHPVPIKSVSQNKRNIDNFTKSLKQESKHLKKDQKDSPAPNLPSKLYNLEPQLKSLETKVKDLKKTSSESAFCNMDQRKLPVSTNKSPGETKIEKLYESKPTVKLQELYKKMNQGKYDEVEDSSVPNRSENEKQSGEQCGIGMKEYTKPEIHLKRYLFANKNNLENQSQSGKNQNITKNRDNSNPQNIGVSKGPKVNSNLVKSKSEKTLIAKTQAKNIRPEVSETRATRNSLPRGTNIDNKQKIESAYTPFTSLLNKSKDTHIRKMNKEDKLSQTYVSKNILASVLNIKNVNNGKAPKGRNHSKLLASVPIGMSPRAERSKPASKLNISLPKGNKHNDHDKQENALLTQIKAPKKPNSFNVSKKIHLKGSPRLLSKKGPRIKENVKLIDKASFSTQMQTPPRAISLKTPPLPLKLSKALERLMSPQKQKEFNSCDGVSSSSLNNIKNQIYNKPEESVKANNLRLKENNLRGENLNYLKLNESKKNKLMVKTDNQIDLNPKEINIKKSENINFNSFDYYNPKKRTSLIPHPIEKEKPGVEFIMAKVDMIKSIFPGNAPIHHENVQMKKIGKESTELNKDNLKLDTLISHTNPTPKKVMQK